MNFLIGTPYPYVSPHLQKIRESHKQTDKWVVNSINGKPSHRSVEDVTCDMEASFAPESQTLSYIEFQTIDEA